MHRGKIQQDISDRASGRKPTENLVETHRRKLSVHPAKLHLETEPVRKTVRDRKSYLPHGVVGIPYESDSGSDTIHVCREELLFRSKGCFLTTRREVPLVERCAGVLSNSSSFVNRLLNELY